MANGVFADVSFDISCGLEMFGCYDDGFLARVGFKCLELVEDFFSGAAYRRDGLFLSTRFEALPEELATGEVIPLCLS